MNRSLPVILLAVAMNVLISIAVVGSVELKDDPNGFAGIAWGASLQKRSDMTLVDDAGRIKTYARGDTAPPIIADARLETRYVTIEGKFARVSIRYEGQAVHDRLLSHLEQRYGALDHIPGRMTRGLNQQYTWRGRDTEINLTYQGGPERGFLFFDSRILAPRFNDTVGE